MPKIMTILGTRPELIKMSRVIAEFERYTTHVLVHTGQNFDYELNQIFFDDLGIRKPDHFLNAAGATPAETIARVIESADKVIELEKPDAIMLYGDTNSGLAVIPAKRRKVPVFHMEAGNRCFDQRVPEELNRKVLDHLSDINMVLTERARAYLLDEGIRPETIFRTGSHMCEVLEHYADAIEKSDVLARQALTSRQYFIVSAHREENVDSPEALNDLLDTLIALHEQYGYPVLVSTHPRTRIRLEQLGRELPANGVTFAKPFGFIDYIKLQREAFCVLSDSGTITEEASLLNLPAIMIRNAHERPEGMDVGTLIMSGLRTEGVLNAVRVVTDGFSAGKRRTLPVSDYNNPNVSTQVLRIVLSYIDYINRTVWHKPGVA